MFLILGRSSFEYERLCDNCIDLNNFGQCAHALLTYCFLVTLLARTRVLRLRTAVTQVYRSTCPFFTLAYSAALGAHSVQPRL